MSYYQPQPTKNRTALWVIATVVTVAVLAGGAYFVGRGEGGAATPSGSAAPAGPSTAMISWSIVGDEPVPASPGHGPRDTEGGLAKGFSHDTLGAVLAAVNIGFRLASEAGPQVYESTAREQCFGDVNSEITQIRNSFSNAPPGDTKPSEIWYRVASGDPAGDLVLMSIGLKTPQSVARGGYAGLDMTMQWVDGDWKMQVPLARPSIIPSVSGYTLLGRPNV
ncbi:MAG: hypothetical protein ACRDQX_09255 [Pseudonocardiaceae bacterium]